MEGNPHKNHKYQHSKLNLLNSFEFEYYGFEIYLFAALMKVEFFFDALFLELSYR